MTEAGQFREEWEDDFPYPYENEPRVVIPPVPDDSELFPEAFDGTTNKIVLGASVLGLVGYAGVKAVRHLHKKRKGKE